MRALVTGSAGFIGSNLVDRLLEAGHSVIGFDNFSTGRMEFLNQARQSSRFRLERGDVLDLDHLTRAMQGCDLVFHMAANADVRFGLDHPRKDLEQNTIATWNVLEAMRAAGIRRIVFPSTGSVYGEPRVFPTPEDAAFPVQTSLYAASKLAAEGLIAAYCEGFGMQSYIFRFVSILGERYTHGHVVDFYRQLRDHPEHLDVLGNGRQRKSYLYIQDCIAAMLTGIEKAGERVNIYNLGADEYCEVNDSIRWICGHLGIQPEIRYAGGDRGWVGDSPFIFLDCRRIRALGWEPELNIRQSVLRTLAFLQNHEWILTAEA
ncbi:MAG: NAD-dependent epimerase/dehydratase family protein [Bryobacteraceae bacterium]